MNKATGILLLVISLPSAAQRVSDLTITLRNGTTTRGVLRFEDTTAFQAAFTTPALGFTASYTLQLPRSGPPSGGGYLFCGADWTCIFQQVTGGGGFPVTNVTASLPITSSGGTTPNIACPSCMRNDANNTPSGAFTLGTTGNWWLAVYSGTFQVPVSGCSDAAFISGTSLFGGDIYVKNSSCVVQARMNSNGFDTVNTVGSYRIQGVQVIDASRNATVNNLTILGTCIGCPTSGGGSVVAVSATAPLLSSGGSTPTISCPNCFEGTSGKINTPGFNVELGTASNWLLRVVAQNHQVSVGPTCADAAMVTGTGLFGGEIYVKNGVCSVTARLNSNGVFIPAQAAISGQRYACIDTSGRIVSSASACSGL